ncbi:hypothetical protein L484_019958 [Morus notabilis]|uniref:Uncharacterized protein n=1 Tax=Morus notabilis TaxID=981085 RepID=W9RJM5_9ROSA|nr:hypothetical protein L484_019958 [Morus notabilis]
MDDQLVQQPHVVIFPFPTQGYQALVMFRRVSQPSRPPCHLREHPPKPPPFGRHRSALPNLVGKGVLPFADEDDMNEESFNSVPGGLEGLLRRSDDLPFFFTSKHSHPRLQFRASVGPLHVVAGATSYRSNSSLWKEEESCLAWLDSQPSKSVLYVNFGSTMQTTYHQLLEFWHASNQ